MFTGTRRSARDPREEGPRIAATSVVDTQVDMGAQPRPSAHRPQRPTDVVSTAAWERAGRNDGRVGQGCPTEQRSARDYL